MTHGIPLDQLDADRLDSLVANRVQEGRQLEFKEALPGSTDEAKREFLADVSCFANATGGDLIYGIREGRNSDGRPTGEADAIVGVPGLNVDAEKLRLGAIVQDGLQPRLPAIEFHEIKRGQEAPCLVLRIRRSWFGPHMVTFKNLSRFYSRNSARKELAPGS